MNWSTEYFDEADGFEDRVRDFLLQEEALHNVTLGILRTLQESPEYYSDDNMLACVHDGDRVGGVVVRTPPFPGLLSRAADDEAVFTMVEALVDTYPELNGINAPKETAEVALERLEQLGFKWKLGKRQRLYRTTTVEPPTGVSGEMRKATIEHRELLEDWFARFRIEAEGRGEEDARENARSQAEFFVQQDAVRIWVDGNEPVSMAAIAGQSPNGLRIGYVFTPQKHRNNGFASAVTAALTKEAFDSGCDHCFLFADLENPTANRIYPALGYEPVADQHVYELTPAKAGQEV